MPRRIELGRDFSDVFEGNGSRHRLLEQLAPQVSSRRLVVISDQQVEAALRPTLCPDAEWLVVPSGESSKCLEVAASLWSRLCQLGVDRQTAILSVGGGMVSDLAGYVASSYLRGLPFYSIPTSLLAMVDASVGGKVGIDLPEGKNLVGAFYPARSVAIDPELLDSLPDSEWASGMAEVIKHGVLQGAPLWDSLLAASPEEMADRARREALLRQAVGVKLWVVEQDPYERTGLRATLNLGHTFGHALEWCSSYQLRHGEAVALGMLAALRLSRSLGLLEEDFETPLTDLLRRWSLPVSLPQPEAEHWGWEGIARAFGRDKKNSEGRWTFILPRRVGLMEIVSGPDPEAVRDAVESLKKVPVSR